MRESMNPINNFFSLLGVNRIENIGGKFWHPIFGSYFHTLLLCGK